MRREGVSHWHKHVRGVPVPVNAASCRNVTVSFFQHQNLNFHVTMLVSHRYVAKKTGSRRSCGNGLSQWQQGVNDARVGCLQRCQSQSHFDFTSHTDMHHVRDHHYGYKLTAKLFEMSISPAEGFSWWSGAEYSCLQRHHGESVRIEYLTGNRAFVVVGC